MPGAITASGCKKYLAAAGLGQSPAVRGAGLDRPGRSRSPGRDASSAQGRSANAGNPRRRRALPRQAAVHYLVNKPPGMVSTNRDPAGRPRVIDLVPDGERLFTVGRLDMSSEGLILVTNDGELANRLAHPRYGVEKTYQVEVAGTIWPKRPGLAPPRRAPGRGLCQGQAHEGQDAVQEEHDAGDRARRRSQSRNSPPAGPGRSQGAAAEANRAGAAAAGRIAAAAITARSRTTSSASCGMPPPAAGRKRARPARANGPAAQIGRQTGRRAKALRAGPLRRPAGQREATAPKGRRSSAATRPAPLASPGPAARARPAAANPVPAARRTPRRRPGQAQLPAENRTIAGKPRGPPQASRQAGRTVPGKGRPA